MSKAIYWGVFRKRKTQGSRRVWAQRFHFRYSDAKDECHRWNDYEKDKKTYFVQRVLLETKDAIHYDVYEHEVKRIEKRK